MKKFVKWLILAPVLAAAIIFSVVNRADVTISFNPLAAGSAGTSLTIPLFLALFLAIIFGALLGGAVTWMEQGRHRRMTRDLRAELARLRAEGDRFRLHPPAQRDPQDRSAA